MEIIGVKLSILKKRRLQADTLHLQGRPTVGFAYPMLAASDWKVHMGAESTLGQIPE